MQTIKQDRGYAAEVYPLFIGFSAAPQNVRGSIVFPETLRVVNERNG